MSFLDKANRQRDAGNSEAHTESSTQGKLQTNTVEKGVKVPDQLKEVDAFYTSETDESFEPVAIKWSGASKGNWPGNGKIDACSYFLPQLSCPVTNASVQCRPDEFASLITGSKSTASNISSSIETISEKSFDPRKQYSGVIKAVRAAASASSSDANESDVDVKIYRVELDQSRVEYWVVALDSAEGRIVGLRAKAVES